MSGYVWDASALLAFLRREPGFERLEEALDETQQHLLSAVTLAEIVSWFNERGMPDETLRTLLDELDLEVIALDTPLAQTTGELRQATKALGLSLGDRACLALAKARQAVALTADRSWNNTGLDISIECVHPDR